MDGENVGAEVAAGGCVGEEIDEELECAVYCLEVAVATMIGIVVIAVFQGFQEFVKNLWKK